MTLTRRRVLVLVAVLTVGAALFVASGVISIKASSGHWPVTAWILDFAKRRSVALHSTGIEVPALDDQALVLRGAGHYEGGCRPCHGSPGTPTPQVPSRMTPHPPALREQVSRWSPEELFYIVKHGIKFTGMPAWPAVERDDEVWAMVAFLRVLPTLDRAKYERLVFGESRAGVESESLDEAPAPAGPVAELLAQRCVRCHGTNGEGREIAAAFPALAGQRSEYLSRALFAYARGARRSGTMIPIAAALDAGAIRAIADHYSRIEPRTTAPETGPSERGAEIVRHGIPAAKVPPCAECHGPTERDRNPAYPILAGQAPDYLVLQLRLFAEGRRGGSEYAHLMQRVAVRLTPEQMADAASYYAALPASSVRSVQ